MCTRSRHLGSDSTDSNSLTARLLTWCRRYASAISSPRAQSRSRAQAEVETTPKKGSRNGKPLTHYNPHSNVPPNLPTPSRLLITRPTPSTRQRTGLHCAKASRVFMPSLAPSALPLSNSSSTRRRSSLSDNGDEDVNRRPTTFRNQLLPSIGNLDSRSPDTAMRRKSAFTELSLPSSSPPLRTLPPEVVFTEATSNVHNAHHHSHTHSSFTYMSSNNGSYGHHIHIPSSPLSRSAASLSDMTSSPHSRRLSLSPSSPPYLPHHAHHARHHDRRPSIHHSHSESLIGSYEESLLSGRTSTPSSKPAVTFLARIGVLGTGENCPPKLKCPRHLSLEFEAVYYDWQLSHAYGARGTPYVGMLDVEEYYTTKAIKEGAKESVAGNDRKRHKKHSKSSAFLGYRIPQQGQIQIVISNPHRTAIKLFLIPYNLREMPIGSRTFLRQKTVVMDEGTGPKGSLRQAVHLHVVCPSEGRYYLFKTVRVVFENRALDATATSGHGLAGMSVSSSFSLPGSSRESVKVETIMGDYSLYNRDNNSKTERRRSSAASTKLRCPLAFPPIVHDECAIAEDEHVSEIARGTSKLSLSTSASDMDDMVASTRDGSRTKDKFIQSKKIENRRLLQQQSNAILCEDENENSSNLITWGELYSRRLNNNI